MHIYLNISVLIKLFTVLSALMLRNVGNDPKINVRWLEGCSEFAIRHCQFLVFEPLGLFANTITIFVWLNLSVVWSPSIYHTTHNFLICGWHSIRPIFTTVH